MVMISEAVSEAHRAGGYPVGQASPGAHRQGPQPAMGVQAGAGQSGEGAHKIPHMHGRRKLGKALRFTQKVPGLSGHDAKKARRNCKRWPQRLPATSLAEELLRFVVPVCGRQRVQGKSA